MQSGQNNHLARGFVALCAFLDLDYVVGHQPVCLAVDCLRSLHVRRVEQAEDLAVLLVEPVLEDLRPVLALGFEIPLVCAGHRFGGRSFYVFVVVHVQRHRT
jgi:hypothetical protein